jgi:hypothetical protein
MLLNVIVEVADAARATRDSGCTHERSPGTSEEEKRKKSNDCGRRKKKNLFLSFHTHVCTPEAMKRRRKRYQYQRYGLTEVPLLDDQVGLGALPMYEGCMHSTPFSARSFIFVID